MILPIAALALLAANVVSFSLMAHDKRMARSGGRRVPEKTLFLASACFGGLGGVLGMQLMRHKTKHWYFRAFFPILLAVQAILLLAGLYLLRRVP
ncbi:MAG: DUF1294 domain-containing protein [Clostridia bacterium]|nr:DUF1294 domain-containing protein [Clostridia bacterium]